MLLKQCSINPINSFNKTCYIPNFTQNILKENVSDEKKSEKTMPIYSKSDEIKTEPAQLSLFQIHDFHGQNIRMERAYTVSKLFDNDGFVKNSAFFDLSKPVDKLKFSAGDIFLGEKPKELAVADAFLNISGIEASAIGNHECDMAMEDMVEIVKDRKYKFLGANMHPDKDSKVNEILSESYVREINGNRYGIIGAVPPDLANHLKYPETVDNFNISDVEQTKQDLQKEVDKLKSQGVNKIILLSHLGLRTDKKVAEGVSGIDVILSAHTHSYLGEIKKGENLLTSPVGEPVVITQVGRDGEFIAVPNVKFNELGQVTDVQYNIVKTDDFSRNLIAKYEFESILGKPEKVGFVNNVEEPPADIYAFENSHCDFILDCLKNELNADIAMMNSANIRGNFCSGEIDTRLLAQLSPFGNNVALVKVSEAEIVDRLQKRIEVSMKSKSHRPGILQVSGLKYTYSMKDAKILSMSFIDKNGKEQIIDVNNPRTDKLYTLAADDFCITSPDSGLNLQHRFDEALQKFDVDKDYFVASYLRKHKEPVNIKSDSRITVVD